jgi:hypothetical protein
MPDAAVYQKRDRLFLQSAHQSVTAVSGWVERSGARTGLLCLVPFALGQTHKGTAFSFDFFVFNFSSLSGVAISFQNIKTSNIIDFLQ